MKRLEKINFLNGIREGNTKPMDLFPYIMIVCDTSLPEEQREYTMFFEGETVPISKRLYAEIRVPIVLMDRDDINL